MTFTRTLILRLFLSGLALLISASGSAVVKRGGERTLEQLTKESDSIVIGKVLNKKSQFVGRNIETDYEVEVRENLKGKTHQPGKKFTLTVAGGSVTTPPLSQFVEMQAYMYPGEDVALFLNEKPVKVPPAAQKRLDPKSKLLTGPRIVGMNEGKFTVFKDAVDGKDKITRVSMEFYGYVHNDDQLSKIIRAVSTHEANVTSGPVVKIGGGLVTTPQGKELIDRAAMDANVEAPRPGELLTAKKHEHAAEILKRRVAIPMQDLNEFKDLVRKFGN